MLISTYLKRQRIQFVLEFNLQVYFEKQNEIMVIKKEPAAPEMKKAQLALTQLQDQKATQLQEIFRKIKNARTLLSSLDE